MHWQRLLACAVLGAVALTPSRVQAQPSITWHPASPANYSAWGGRNIDLIIIHKAEGSASSTWNWFQNPAAQASAHYVVGDDGAVTQMVADGDVAWHAGNLAYNNRAIGIENSGFTYRDDMSDTHMRALADLVAWLCDQYGIPKDRAHVIGHNEVPDPYNPGQFGGFAHHQDPGPYFDWATFMSYVGGSTPPPPPPPPSAGVAGLQVTGTVNVRDAAWGNILGQASRGVIFAGTGNEDQGFSEIWFRGGTAWISTGYLTRASQTGAQVNTGTLNVRWDTRTDPSTLVGEVHQDEIYAGLLTDASGSWRLIQYDTRREWVWKDYTTEVSLD